MGMPEMRRTLLILLVAGTALAQSPATAATFHVSHRDRGRLGRILPTARGRWPGSPWIGRETFSYLPRDPAAFAALGLPPAPGGLGYNGAAQPATGRVWIARGLDNYELCYVLTHEEGHLAGHTHAEGGVMAATQPFAVYRPCAVFLPRVHPDRWRQR